MPLRVVVGLSLLIIQKANTSPLFDTGLRGGVVVALLSDLEDLGAAALSPEERKRVASKSEDSISFTES
jgi:hypothetical protein